MLTFYNPYALGAISTIGGFLFGSDISSVSAFLAVDSYLDYFGHPDDITQGGITAAMPAGAFIGANIGGYVSDRLGRKKSLLVSIVFWIVGCILACAAQDVAMLVVGRIVKGVTVGWTSGQVPAYLAEQSPKAIRGRLVGLQQLSITLGILVMFYISYGCSFIAGTTSFRLAWGLQLVPGVLFAFGLLFLPESIRWLGTKGRWEEAEYIMARIHGMEVNDPYIQAEIAELKEAVRIEETMKKFGFLDLFRPQLLTRTFCAVGAQVWSQLQGVNVMMYYIVYVFQMAGLTGNTNLTSSSIQYVINFVMTIPAILWVDNWGRRPTLLIGALLMAGWMFATSGLLATYGHYVDGIDDNPDIRWTISGAPSKGVIACSFLFVATYAVTWAPLSWVYISEIMPLPARAAGAGLATSTNWIMNFALSFFVPPAFRNIQWKTYIIFAVFCLASFLHVFFFFHETKGRSLEEISAIFESGKRPFLPSHKLHHKVVHSDSELSHEPKEIMEKDQHETDHIAHK
ncbi:general substrate transporter [Stereum hirsutum FP-91666 SS1]|uniref:general substrate transporter n=1 Tax=Stereum hirsutum (strain FP-91666) TaxID=721885 RepID=UPI000444964F|nr:general substrate transporter [Stereum hirsutum FP-91666 SS1]EIM84473.1 general substrate transporter [Stereum hirsutum FP-91666 SS1]